MKNNKTVTDLLVVEAIQKSNSFNMLAHNLSVLEEKYSAVSQLLSGCTEDERIVIGYSISERIVSYLKKDINEQIYVNMTNLDKIEFTISLRLEVNDVWKDIVRFSILPTVEFSFTNEIMDTSTSGEEYIRELATELEDLKKYFHRLTAKSLLVDMKVKWFSILQPSKQDQFKSEFDNVNERITAIRAEYTELSNLYDRDIKHQSKIAAFMKNIKSIFTPTNPVDDSLQGN